MTTIDVQLNDRQRDPGEQVKALGQVRELVSTSFPHLQIALRRDGLSFASLPGETADNAGVAAVSGRLTDEGVIVTRLQILTAHSGIRVQALPFVARLSQLGNRSRLYTEDDPHGKGTRLGVELGVQAVPLSFTRGNTFSEELRKVAELAKDLQAELPLHLTDEDLARRYQGCADHLQPVLPPVALLDPAQDAGLSSLTDWAAETLDFLLATGAVALVTRYPTELDVALSVLARAGAAKGETLGRVIHPAIPTKGLVELAKKAPGIVAMPASSLSFGSSPYELGQECRGLLRALASMGKRVVFCGTNEELQAVFHGGQGGTCDPLSPVVRHIPNIPVEVLCRHAVNSAARLAGGLPPKAEQSLVETIRSSLDGRNGDESARLLPALSRRAVENWLHGEGGGTDSARAFLGQVETLSETFGGLAARPRAHRLPHVQKRFVRILTDEGLPEYFTSRLLAQDDALGALCERLQAEALARPPYQPLRYCAQGTPGTGKSESAVLLARKLDIPYVNIDAASMPDYYTASSQLLGSGRGIVGSYQSGRLEQAAKHHVGCVVEVSDLDHAVPHVRSALADLFLQILETGEAQSATGSMFSCANLIFAFTMNLPEGLDESVRKRIGFDGRPSRHEILSKVTSELKRMLSGAFLSRVGTPILFEPLGNVAMAAIAELAVQEAVRSAFERVGVNIASVRIEQGLGMHIVGSAEQSSLSFGARVILERARLMATQAVLAVRRAGSISGSSSLVVVHEAGCLSIRAEGEET